jgi:predicted transcriptional regulator
MKQTTVRFSEETNRQIQQLAEWLETTNTAVLAHAVQQTLTIETARRHLSDSDFVGFLAEIYRPIE